MSSFTAATLSSSSSLPGFPPIVDFEEVALAWFEAVSATLRKSLFSFCGAFASPFSMVREAEDTEHAGRTDKAKEGRFRLKKEGSSAMEQ